MFKCYHCQSEKTVKYGKNKKGNQRHLCKNCHSILVEDGKHRWLTDNEKILILKLAKEGLSEHGIARVIEKDAKSIHEFLKKNTQALITNILHK